MGSPSLLLFAALLGQSDDAWRAPALESTFDSRLRELADFPAPLYPSDLEEEVTRSLEDLARLDTESAAVRARSLLRLVSPDSGLAWTSRRVLAASGDLETLRLALRSYFEASAAWRTVLAASRDPRLRDFGEQDDSPVSQQYFLTTLERNLARARERDAVRALLAWASTSKDASSPRRVLEALPEGVPLEAAVRGWLRRAFPSAEETEPPLFTGEEAPLEIQQRILALPPDARYAPIRWLAERDHEALLGLPVSREHIDRLYPYFARSSRRALRGRVKRASRERGRALASILLSTSADATEKRETLRAMPDAWAGAIASAGTKVYEEMASLLPREDLDRFIAGSAVDESYLDALAVVPLAEARRRLEAMGTAEAVERLRRRPDVILSVPALDRLRRGGDFRISRPAALALVSLGAPGSSAWLRAELATSSDLVPILEAVMRGPAEPEIALELARRVASEPGPSPSGFAALARLPLAGLASAGPEALADRVRLAMAMTGDRKYLPVLVDLAVGSIPGASRASRGAAFAALAEAELGSFGTRLHRLAGAPDRDVRFRAAAALVPSGEAWTLRLLLGNLDPASPSERALARSAVRRLSRERAMELLDAMIADGTARTFGVLLYLELADEAEVRRRRPLQARLFRSVADEARAGDPTALLAASRLSLPEAIAVVTAYLSAHAC
jgi:hypothetical protein